MTALVISISSDVSVESVGSSFLRVILIGSIPVEVPVIPEVGAAAVASPAGVLKLDTHSSSEADPSESSLPPVSVAPIVSPFLCSDDSESDTEIPERHYPLAPIVALPRNRQRRAILIRPEEDIHIGRLYRTHPGGPCRALSLTHPDTIEADSSKPPRFVQRIHLLGTPHRCSEAYLRWRSVPLSIMYPPIKSESLAGDSSSESSARPSRKRCRSPAAILTSSILAMRALVTFFPFSVARSFPSHGLRFLFTQRISVERRIDIDVLEDIEADATVVEVAVDKDVKARVDTVDLAAGIDIPDAMLMPDAVDRLEQFRSRGLIAGEERASLLEQVASLERINNMTITRSGMTPEAIKELVNRRVEEALAAYEATRTANALEAESQSQNGRRLDGPEEGGHYRSDCPKLKDQNRGNKAGNKNDVGDAGGKAYVLGGGDANPDSNVVKDSFCRYGFSALLDVNPRP
ncbi:hypothetical protein Tco_1483356 [Tanacetum coccineum]